MTAHKWQISHLVGVAIFLKAFFLCVSVILQSPIIRLTWPSIWAPISHINHPCPTNLTVHLPSSAELFMDVQTAGPQRHSKETQGHGVPHILLFYFQLVYVDLLSIQKLWHFPHSVVSNALEAGNLTPSARFCVVLLRCCFVYLFISFYQNTHRTQNAKCAEPRL